MIRRVISVILAICAVFCAGAQSLLGKGESRELHVDKGDGGGLEINVTAVVKGDRPRSGMSVAKWGIAWADEAGNPDSIVLQWGNSDFGMDGDKRFLRISSGGISEDTPAIHVGQETIALSVSIDSRGLVWCVGQDRVMGRGSRKLNSVPVRSTLRIFSEGRDLLIERLEVLGFMDPITDAMTPFVSADCFSRPDDITMSPAGVWRYLDRDNNPDWNRPGGKYTLGILADDSAENSWIIIYLDGAVTNSVCWAPGMRKGRLADSGFLRDFNLEWTDAMHSMLGADEECSAKLSEDGMILTLNFPLDKAILRFSRQF